MSSTICLQEGDRRLMISRSYVLLALLAATVSAYGQESVFELVESIPEETSLDNNDIRNTSEVWIEMIDQARQSLDIEQFYISNGEPLEPVIAAIERAADRGVSVRVIADARMYKTYPETVDRLGKRKNISKRIIDYGKLAGGIQHAKFFIVDNKQAFIGSQNFDWRALTHIHELGLRIEHPEAVAFYTAVFEADWNLAETNDKSLISSVLKQRKIGAPFTTIHNADTTIFSPTASPAGILPDSTLWDEPHILNVIENAQHEVNLQFLGYGIKARDKTEYHKLDDALRAAAARGVTVRLMVSDWEKGSSGEKDLKALSTIENIRVKFVIIPEWSGAYIPFARVDHCKFIVADGRKFWLGTSNGEKSYFHNCRNLGIVIEDRKLASRLTSIFLKTWRSEYTERVHPDSTYAPRKHGE